MKIAVFDCPYGIAGDMTVGAFLDAGMPFPVLKKELAKLRLKHYRLSLREEKCGAFRAKKFSVHIRNSRLKHHTLLQEIERRIRASRLHPRIKKSAIAVFRKLGRAEAAVHGIPLGRVHFHEAGAIDSFIDIVGAAICMHHLKISRAFIRNLSVGRGLHQSHHGIMPVPVPGAYQLLKGFVLSQTAHAQEMVTPTGAALLATFTRPNGRIPKMKLESVGYGAGDRSFGGTRGYVRLSIGATATR